MGLGNCCFCIPLRVGVTSIAILSSVFYIAILIFLLMNRQGFDELPQTMISSTLTLFWVFVGTLSLFAAFSLFGVIAGLTQNKTMMNIFRFLYWTVTLLLFISSTAFWIYLMIQRDSVTTGCQQFMALNATTSITSTYSPVTLPDGTDGGLYHDYCASLTRQVLIISGVLVFVGNLVQIYFASVIGAYARRLKAGMTSQHQQLRDLDDFPDKMSIY
ncbi:hypothetical protein EDC96DRAFT_574019 [Choanephora cucurbitarum]|nr:hypothetical protein EDC96DRAFT_574019 [Choanephora cucurbitarum]